MPASPVVGEVFGWLTKGVVGPVGVLDFLHLRFADARKKRCGGFGPSAEVVVAVDDDTGNSSNATSSDTSAGGLSGGWGVQLRDEASNGGGEQRNWAWS